MNGIDTVAYAQVQGMAANVIAGSVLGFALLLLACGIVAAGWGLWCERGAGGKVRPGGAANMH